MKIIYTLVLLLLFMVAGILFILFRHHDTTQISAPIRSAADKQATSGIRYLALGDSYTIGQSVSESERWPNQLTARLRVDGTDITIIGNPSVTGYTTQNLIDHELPLLASTNPNFVTIQIGVNDYVQGVPAATFQNNFRSILDEVQAKVTKNRIVVVTIPDYAKTPTGAKYGDPTAATATIKSFNDFIVRESTGRGITSVDIYPISQGVVTDASLTSSDGLHPSGAQYKLWTDLIYQSMTNAKILNVGERIME